MGILDAPSLSKTQADVLYVPKETGKGLSKNDYTDSDKAQVAIAGSTLLQPARNLFNVDKAQIGYYLAQNSATPVLSAGFGISDYIPVVVGQAYTGNDLYTGGMRFTTYFDASKALVAGGSSITTTGFTVPAGVAFVRVTFVTSSTYPIRFMFQAGSGTVWEPYRQEINRDYRVRADSAGFVQKSVNLFNKNTAIDGFFYDANGNRAATSVNGYSDYIKVTPGFIYIAWNNFDASPIRMHVYYDKDYNVVAGGSSSGSTTITVPTATSVPIAYVRLTYNVGTVGNVPIGKNSFQFQFGQAQTTYKPFSYSLNPAVISSWNTPVWGAEKLRRFHSWKRTLDYRYDLLIKGDSYVDGNYYAKLLYDYLVAKGLPYGGAGYLSFSGANGPLNSNSIQPTKFSSAWTTGDWIGNSGAGVVGTSYAPGAVDIISQTNTATVIATVSEATDTVDLIYKLQPSGGSFRYQINSGSWTTVSTANATTTATSLSINTSSFGASFTITIQALATGISLGGMVARKTGNVLNVHKCGLTGSQASKFGWGAGYQIAENVLTPKGVIYTWGTNETNGSIMPSVMKAYIQNLVNVDRAIDPLCDLLFVCPPQTQYGTTLARNYVAQDYADAMFQLAVENHGCFIDMPAIFGPFGQYQIDYGMMHADETHPGERGKIVYGETLFNVFNPH